MKPTANPSAIEKLNGINKIVKKEGIDSAGSSQSMAVMLPTIKTPTISSTGAVAKGGIADSNGVKKIARVNRIDVTTAVKPLRPPSETPEADSIKSDATSVC